MDDMGTKDLIAEVEAEISRGINNELTELYIYAFKQGRISGIEDFEAYANTMPTVEGDDGEIRPMWLEEMAKELMERDAYGKS